MAKILFAPDADERRGSASSALRKRNVFIERASRPTGNTFELRGRPGLVLTEGSGAPGADYVRGIIPLRDIGGTGHLGLIDSRTLLGTSTQGGPRVVLGNNIGFFLNGGGITAYVVTDPENNTTTSECVKNPLEEDQFVVDDMDYINQRLVAVERDSGRLWYTDVRKEIPSKLLDEQGQVDPTAKVFPDLNYTETQYASDDAIGCHVIGSSVFVFGRATTEVITNLPNADRPFLREPGGVWDIGLLATGAKSGLNGGFAMETTRSTNKFPMRRVVFMQSREPIRLSTPTVERDLEDLTPEQAAALQMWSFGYLAKTFIAVHVHGLWTWVYDLEGRDWTRFDSHGRTWFDVGFMAMGEQGTLVGSTDGPNVSVLTEGSLDFGQGVPEPSPIEKTISFTLPPQPQRGNLDTVALDMAVPTADAELTLAISEDNGATFEEYVETVPPDADDAGEPIWRGLGSIPSQGATMEVRWSGLEPTAIAAAYINESAKGA